MKIDKIDFNTKALKRSQWSVSGIQCHIKCLSVSRGFTFIELLITLAIIGIIFVPIMQMFSLALSSTAASQDMLTAVNLAQWGMERMKNLKITKEELREVGDQVYPSLVEKPLELNKTFWRIEREIFDETDPLEIRVNVYLIPQKFVTPLPTNDTAYEDIRDLKPVVTLVTLIEDYHWEDVNIENVVP